MYPREFFDSYWRPEIRDEVFVAMPFHDEFALIWAQCFEPAIRLDLDVRLTSRRVDGSVLSGSIVTDILDGIAHSRIVLADISVAAEGRWAGQRNGNVMYEVGLAHAVRQTTEVLLVRSDSEPISFDVAGLNIRAYDRSDMPGSRALIAGYLRDLLQQVEQEKSLKVERAIGHLDSISVRYLAEYAAHGAFAGPDPKTMADELVSVSNRAALANLQHLGILRSHQLGDGGGVVFSSTAFGDAVMRRLGIAR